MYLCPEHPFLLAAQVCIYLVLRLFTVLWVFDMLQGCAWEREKPVWRGGRGDRGALVLVLAGINVLKCWFSPLLDPREVQQNCPTSVSTEEGGKSFLVVLVRKWGWGGFCQTLERGVAIFLREDRKGLFWVMLILNKLNAYQFAFFW